MKKNTTKTTNLFLKFTAILLALTILAGAVFFILEFCSPSDSFLKPSGWFQPAAPTDPAEPNDPAKNPDEPLTSDKELTDGSLKIGDVVTAEGVRLSMAKLAAEHYEDYGISAQAESAVTLTITVEPDYAQDKTFDWTYRLKDSDSDYLMGTNANGRPQQYPLSDFFSLRVADDTLSAVAECKRDFWEQFEIVATYRTNPYIQVSCTCDYIQKMKSGSGQFRTQSGSLVDMTDFKLPSNPEIYASYYVSVGELTNGTILLDVEWDPIEMELNGAIFSSLLDKLEIKTLGEDAILRLDSDWLLQFFIEGERTPDKYSKLKAAYGNNSNYGVIFSRRYTLKKDGEVISSGGCQFEVGIDFSANTILDATGDKDSIIF